MDYVFINLPYGISSFHIHKLHLGIMIVVIDIASVMLCQYIFSTLTKMNHDFIETMDNHIIKMSGFVTTINQLKIDRHSQDLRILIMKHWLHFNQILESK